MITAVTQSISGVDIRFNRENFIRLLRPFAANLPTFYLLFVIPFALLGYAVLLLFPMLTIWFYYQMIGSLYTAPSYQQWSTVLLHASFMLITAVISVALMRISFNNPAGLEVSDKRTPALSGLIHKLLSQYGNPRLAKILITREDKINVVRTPLNWFPIRSRNTLQIGFPVLLCSSPVLFMGMLAREIARLSSHQNPVTGWLLNLHGQWAIYYQYLEKNNDYLLKPLAIFFRYYSPTYNAISFFAARRAEIRADRYMREVMEDDEVIMAITQEIIFRHFLKEKYWPRVNSQARSGKQKLFLPYKKMSATIRKNIKREDTQRWIEAELANYGDSTNTLPPLNTRLWLLGYQDPVYPPPLEETAADEYLNKPIVEMLSGSFDRSWARREGFTIEN